MSSMRKERGWALVEAAVAVTVVAVCIVGIAHRLQTPSDAGSRATHAGTRADLISRADEALRAFALRNGRLPCPAVDGAGNEACGVREGFVPFRTLGLPDAGAGAVHYSLPGSATIDLSLAPQQQLRLEKLVMGDPNRASLQTVALRDFGETSPPPAGAQPNYEWCTALSKKPISASIDPAYGLQAGGAGGVPLQRLTRGRGELWAEMKCGPLLATTVRAHGNLAGATRMQAIAQEDSYIETKTQADYVGVYAINQAIGLGVMTARATARVGWAIRACADAASNPTDAAKATSCMLKKRSAAIQLAWLPRSVTTAGLWAAYAILLQDMADRSEAEAVSLRADAARIHTDVRDIAYRGLYLD